MNKPITVWERHNSSEYDHNHIEDGWANQETPTSKNPSQKKAWGKETWRKFHMELDENNHIVSPKDTT